MVSSFKGNAPHASSAAGRAAESGMTLAFIAVGMVVGGWLIVGRRLALAWYLREVRGVDLPLFPENAIITYPLT
jgi:hypothetical protein